MAITAPTPMIMPKSVKKVRSLLEIMPSRAILIDSLNMKSPSFVAYQLAVAHYQNTLRLLGNIGLMGNHNHGFALLI